MTQSTEAALGSLVKSASSHAADLSLDARLAEAQALLSDDLAWVEVALREAAARGPEPAVNAARHLVEMGGKRVRPMALLLASACFGPVPHASRQLAVCVELIHSATLLHDDVIDEGTERWLLPQRLSAYTSAPVVDTAYFTFLPEFVPASVLRLFRPLEALLERSPLRMYSAHYMAVVKKPAVRT